MGAFGRFAMLKMCFMATAMMVLFVAPRAHGHELLSSWEQDKAYLQSMDSQDDGYCAQVFEVL